MAKELTFRDGMRAVPDHVADLLSSVETWKYTYQDAMRVANNELLQRRLMKVQQDMLRDHFKALP